MLKENNPKAIDIFNELSKGVSELCKAADVYTIHIMAELRNTEPDKDVIHKILFENSVSFFNLVGEAYSKEEFEKLKKDRRLRYIGEQILLSSYTALEIYLIEKFKEYYRYYCSNTPINIVEKTIKRFSFRSIDNIKRHYGEILNIKLPSFEIDRIFTTTKTNFEPKTSWDAICMLAKERNHIAHTGKTKDYQIFTLLDSWYPFDFVRRWVLLFNVNFDMFIYEKRESGLIKEYKQRLTDIHIEKLKSA